MTLELQNLRLSSKKRLYYYLDIEIEGSEFRLLSQSPAIFFVNSTVKPWKSSRYDTLHLSIWPISELVQWLQLPMSHQSYFFVNGVQITRRYDRKLDYGLQFYIQESPSLSVKFRVFEVYNEELKVSGWTHHAPFWYWKYFTMTLSTNFNIHY